MNNDRSAAAALHEESIKACFGKVPPPAVLEGLSKSMAPTLTNLQNIDEVSEFRRQVTVEAKMFNALAHVTSPSDKLNYLKVRGDMVAGDLSNAVFKMDMLSCVSRCPNRDFVPEWVKGALSVIMESKIMEPLKAHYYLLASVHLAMLKDWPQVQLYAEKGVASLVPGQSCANCASELYRMLGVAHLFQDNFVECGDALDCAWQIASEVEDYIPALRMLLFKTLEYFYQKMDDLQEVEKWRGEAMALSQKHTIEELGNEEPDKREGEGNSGSPGRGRSCGLN